MSRIVIPSMKPRNPVALPARRRQAGSHGPSTGACRQAARLALRHELAQLAPEPPRIHP